MSDAFALPATWMDRLPSAGVAASLLVHCALALALVWLSPLRPMLAPLPQPVAVEIVTEQQFAALAAPAVTVVATPSAPVAPPPASAAPVATTPAPTSGPGVAAKVDKGVVTATQFYAAGILREPGMERIRAALGKIDPNERLVQLCNIEGLEQIRRADPGFYPDTLVSYAMEDTSTDGMTLLAPGGAFRSRRKWYGIAFKCTVAADFSGVTAFSFKLGAAIPEDQWDDHNLNAEDVDE